MNLEFVKDWI